MRRSLISVPGGLAILGFAVGRAHAADLPAGYVMIKSTAAGRAMAVHHTKPASVKDAIEAVLNDLDDFFDDDYTFYGAAANADQKSGFCIISAKYQGQPVRGIVSARMVAKGAMGVVVFCRTDAPPAAWAELTGGPPATKTAEATPGAATPAAARSPNPLNPGGPPAAVAAPAPTASPSSPAAPAAPAASPPPPPPAPVRLTEYRFPDNTGSIGVAEGYRTNAQSGGGATIEGPAGQSVLFGASVGVQVPTSSLVRMAMQYPVPGAPPMLIAPFGDPAQAVAALTPQFSRMNVAKGAPAIEADHIQLVEKLPSQMQGDRRAVVRYGLTKTEHGQRTHFQTLAEVSLTPTSSESFMFYISCISAPDLTAQADFPVLLQMLASWRTNDAQIQANTRQWIAGRQQWFAGEQAAQATVQQGYADKNTGWRANQVTVDRSMDDVSETIRGVRDIEDLRTGELNPANLGNVDQIVDDLNRQDPGRYKALPLRDKLDPKP